MAQDERTRAEDVVDVLAAGEVAQAGAASLLDDERQLLRGVVSAEDAPGKDAHRPLKKRVFFELRPAGCLACPSLERKDWPTLYPIAAEAATGGDRPTDANRPTAAPVPPGRRRISIGELE